MSVFDGAEFKRLRAEWIAKLKATGFEDQEDARGNLYRNDIHQFLNRSAVRDGQVLEIRAYYTWATAIMSVARFQSRTDEMIWVMHAEGKSSRQIADHVCLDQRWVSRKIGLIRGYLKLQGIEGDCE